MSIEEQLGDAPQPRVPSPPEQMVQMVTAFWASKSLYVIAKLGVADLLTDGPRTSAELAEASGAHEPSLYRILRTLASLGVFTEEEDRTFSLRPLGATLVSDAPGSLRNFVTMMGEAPIWRAWEEMLHAAKTGETGFEKAVGTPLFDYLGEHPEEAMRFGETMIEFHGPEAAAVTAAYDFSDLKRVVDVGGGYGNLLATVLHANPGLEGVLFELPHVADEASEHLDAEGLADRCEVVPGDFFESIPTGGDAYILSHIVHDWDEPRCLTLLETCRRAMPRGARLLIVEMVIPAPNQPSLGKMLDLMMLVSTGGQERTQDEYRKLLAAAGLRLTRVVPTASPVSIVEAVPA